MQMTTTLDRLAKLSACVASVVLATHAAAMHPHDEDDEQESSLSSGTFSGMKLRSIGPAFMSGRISDLVVHPEDQSTWFVAVGSGNIWKTVNSGTTWTPIFDDQGSYSIGCITLDPSNPDVIWVGTGENVGGRHVGYGDGVYRSMDGGKSWTNMGLKDTQHVGMIVVHPEDSNTVFVAAEGPLWSAGGERGLFRTTDGGASWEKILGGGEYTGVNEIHVDPRDPEVMYAVTQQRLRNVAALINGGPESGIHKSTDGGATWRELKNGIPGADKGRIGLAVSPIDPDYIYATIELAHREGGMYRSTDGGESWTKGADYISGGTGPHYYQEIFASPHQLDRVYQMDVRMHVTDDGGKTFYRVNETHKHSDNHALAFDLRDPNYLLSGTDGGIYESWDHGKTWKFTANLPITQFYKVAVDYDTPFYNVVGGTQDNATQHGPSRTDSVNGIRNSDWVITVFGDGHQPAIDPTNPDIIYSQWQQGNLVRHDRKTGEIVYIQPQPAEGEENDRFNWDAPILISPHDSKTLFHASQRLWRSDDRGDSWRAISGDLTRNIDRFTEPMMGRVWSYDALWDLYAMSKYSTITNVSQSPIDENLIYVGTDDGLIQVTEDGGVTWRKIDQLPGVPEFWFVNDIKADLHDADIVYVCVDNHKAGDFSPYVLMSPDRGRTWASLGDSLPDRHIVWRIVQDHVKPELLFLGTEFGVFFSVDRGQEWIELKGGVPNIPFRDLAIQTRENDLVGATFGRGFYILDDYAPLREVSAEALEEDMHLFSVRDAWWYVPRRTLGAGGGKAYQGDGYFSASNPPYGATFTYYLKESLQTRKQVRTEEEKDIKKAGGDTPTPGWDALREEQLEERPAIVLTVRDGNGSVVRRIEGPTSKGIHRVTWSLTYPSVAPWTGQGVGADSGPSNGRDGIRAIPGTYTVHLGQRIDGELIDSGLSQSFDVVPLRDAATLEAVSPDDLLAFNRDFAELNRAVGGARRVLSETADRVAAIRVTLNRSTVEDAELSASVRGLARQISDMQLTLSGDSKRAFRNDPGPISISRRLSVVSIGTSSSLHGPTATHLESFNIARRAFAELRNELDQLVSEDLPALEERLEALDVPWTPGRGVPSP